MAETVLATHADRIVLITMQRNGKGVSPRLLFTDQIDVDVLPNFLPSIQKEILVTEIRMTRTNHLIIIITT